MSELESLTSGPWDDLSRLPRPSSFDLGQYVLGLLPPAAAARVRQYLAEHPHAAAEAALLQTFLAAGEPAVQTPPGLLAQIKVLAARLITGPMGSLGAAAGVRGTEVSSVYQAGDWQIVLDNDSDPEQPGRFVLTGLALGLEKPDQATVTLLAAAVPNFSAAAPLDEFGNFTFLNLPPNQYDLILFAPEPALELHLMGITVGPLPNQ